LRPAIEAGVEQTLERYPGLLNAEATRRLAGNMLDGRRPLDFTLWRILNLGVWGSACQVTV
jgi:asparagine synthase (glutamine-hydrolysing)